MGARPPHGRQVLATRGGCSRAALESPRGTARGRRAGDLPKGQVHAGHNRRPAQRAPSPAHSSQRRLAVSPGARLPAHCQYCYLAGSLPGPPVTRAYANLDELLAELAPLQGRGTVTSRQEARAHEGTTFEASCYTDPLGIEHLTGSLAATILFFAGRPQSGLRFTTKYDAVEELAQLAHGGRTRARFSINAPQAAGMEGGTAPVSARLEALRRLAMAGYPVGLDESRRTLKRTRFGGSKHVYPKELMREMRAFFEEQVPRVLPSAQILYFT